VAPYDDVAVKTVVSAAASAQCVSTTKDDGTAVSSASNGVAAAAARDGAGAGAGPSLLVTC